MNFSDERMRLYRWMRSQLFGAGSDNDREDTATDLTGMKPSERFQCGVLFPVVAKATESVIEVDIDEGDDAMGIDGAEPSQASYVRYVPPSSVGLSFYIEGENAQLEVRAWGVWYEEQKGHGKNASRVWLRHPLSAKSETLIPVECPQVNGLPNSRHIPVFNKSNAAAIQILWRKFGE